MNYKTKFKILLSIFLIILSGIYFSIFLYNGMTGSWGSWDNCWSYNVLSMIFFTFSFFNIRKL
jgi:hypothetical protein